MVALSLKLTAQSANKPSQSFPSSASVHFMLELASHFDVYLRPCSTFVAQILYAALDAYASVRLYCSIMEHADPVLICPHPPAQELRVGVSLRLYTRTNSRFVAEGSLVAHASGEAWGPSTLTVREGRVVVRLTKVHVAAAWMPYPSNLGETPRSLEEATDGELVLWDVVSCFKQMEPFS